MVYTILSSKAIDDVKNIINSILNLAGNGFTWEDFFEIEEIFDESEAEETFIGCNDKEPESYEELKNFVEQYNDRDSGHFIETSLRIKSIDKDSVEAAKLLDNLNYLFYIEEGYE